MVVFLLFGAFPSRLFTFVTYLGFTSVTTAGITAVTTSGFTSVTALGAWGTLIGR